MSSKKSLLDEMDAEEDSDDDDLRNFRWADEECIAKLKSKSRSPTNKRGASSKGKARYDDSDDDDSDDEEGAALGDEDFKKMLGEKEGAAVGNILKKDREMKAEKARNRKRKAVKGVLLWQRAHLERDEKGEEDEDVEMAEEPDLPALPKGKGKGKESALMSALRKAVEDKSKFRFISVPRKFLTNFLFEDERRLATLLQCDTLELLGSDNVAPLLEWVCNLGKNLIPFSLMGSLLTLENQAFSTFSRSLGSEAYSLLCQVPHLFTPAGTIIPFDVTLRALSQLGAKDTALTAVGWTPVPNSSGTSPTEDHREELVLRLLNFVSVYAGYVLLFLSWLLSL